jgi:tRNA G37 N-methylase Trm5
MFRSRFLILAWLGLALWISPFQEKNLPAQPQTSKDEPKAQEKKPKKTDDEDKADREPDVVYWPTPQPVVDKMLELAQVKKDDVVYDLGCGDARILVTAAMKYGCKGFGWDINPVRVKESLENVKKNKVEELVTVKKGDIFTLDLKDANVVTLYLLPELNVRLMPQLEKLKHGSRIVSHDFDMRGAKPKQKVTVKAKNHMGIEGEHTIYLWVVPWEKE